MTKEHIIDLLSDDLGISKAAADRGFKKIFGLIEEELDDGGSIRIPDFGTFSVRRRNERRGRHPQTGEMVTYPAKRVVHFSPSEHLKKRVDFNRSNIPSY